jgi:glycosyltransferase involved in cell wall biosynthesis
MPDVALDPTQLGPVVDDLVVNARRRMRVGVDPDYDLVHDNFDVLHYLLQQRNLMGSPHVDLIQHFLEHGEAEQLSPQPHFSMANYLRQHPQAADSGERSPYLAWLKRGRDAGELADPVPRIDLVAPVLGLETSEVTDLLVARRTDLQQRLRSGRLGEMVAKAAEVEPLIGAAWPAITRPLMMPLINSRAVTAGMSALHRSHEAAAFRPARVVLVVNQARRAPDRGVEGHLTHALAEYVDPTEIVVIYTDSSVDQPFRRHPEGVRELDFARFVADIPEDEDLPEDEDRQQVLVTLLRTFRADAVVNIRSRLLFRSLRTYARALTASERLFLFLSGNEQTAMGTWEGWGPDYLYRIFDRLAGLITDNEYFAGHLTDTYLIPPAEQARVHVLRTPVDPDISLAEQPGSLRGRRPQVFWAGTWGRQRKVDVLLELARRMPDIDFRVWTPGRAANSAALPDNLVVRPGGEDTRALPLHEADLWLHSAAWDSVPAQLLEVAMTGVPIVGTRVGGTSEVIGDDAWPVAEAAGVGSYEQAIRAVLSDPGEARRRAAALRERMLAERDRKRFATAVAELLLTSDDGAVGRTDA